MTRRGRGRPPYPDILTPAEWRVLEEVRTGATNAEIAVRLGVSPFTVKYHISNILGKLQLRNRRQIATWQPAPERVRFPQMAAARLRALAAPLLAPFGFLSKPVVGFAVAAAVALVAIPAIVVAVLLTRPSEEPVNVLVSPDPSPSPAVPATVTPTPTPTPAPSPTPAPQATPTPTPTPAPEPEPTPTPEPDPPPEATPNALGIREVPTDEVLTRLQYPAGEQIPGDTGLFFLNVETGSVEGWQSIDGLPPVPSPGNRYVALEGALHDRAEGRTFTWDASLRRVAWGGGRILFERLGPDAAGDGASYVIVGPSMEPEAEFDIPLGWQIEAWRLQDGLLLASDAGQLHVVDGATGESVAFDRPPGEIYFSPSGEGFVIYDSLGPGGAGPCFVSSYRWPAELRSAVPFPCAGPSEGLAVRAGTGIRPSPDGSLLAAVTRTLGCCPDPPPDGNLQALATVSVFDADTGQEILQVRGAAFPVRWGEDTTVWLSDGSALVVETALGRQVVSLEGDWLLPVPSVLSDGRLLPGSSNPSHFLHDLVTVVDLEGQVVSSANFEEPTLFISSWGNAGQEVRFQQPWVGRGAFPVTPAILPAIQTPPFDDALTAEVVVDSCLNIRAEATTESEVVVCLPPERVVELVAHPADGHVVEGPCVEDDLYGNCIWAYVLTEDGEEGWAYADFLRWPGTAIPGTEVFASEEEPEG